MNLQLNDEQKLLRDSAVRWVAAQVATGAQGAPAGGDIRRERWAAMAGFGWLAMTLPPEHDGLGQSLSEACVLAEALGAGPLADPYLAAIVQAAELIATGASPAQQARWLPDIASGRRLVVPADIERGAPFGSAGPRTRATRADAGWRLDGQKSVVPCGDAADAWLVSARDDAGASRCFLVPRGIAGVHAQDFESVDGAGACSLTFTSVELDEQALLSGADEAIVRCAFDRAAIAACAESVGAMQAMLAATVEYTRTRQQFGKPLALNQVLRHRMADMSVACDEARSMTIGAIQQFEQADARGDATARTLAASAVRAKVAAAARRVAEEAIQLHGGMGVTEELNMGRYLRRLLALDAAYGGAESHLRRHAELRTRQRGGTAIELDNGQPEMAALGRFRDEVRAFLAEQLTPDLVRAARLNTSVFSEADIALRWQQALYRQGWVAPGWPSEYGGTGWSLAQRWIFETECAVAGAPPLSPLGLRMAGPVIMRFGTPEQKAHYLPRILAGDDYWCQGYSEPGSGSDLASLKTRARREQDVYVINGSKIWTTHAHKANRMFALVRTGEGETRKQDGISFLLIDMATPGITVRPIRSASGDHEVNQVFFDDVRVPVSCRVGDEGQGWTIAKYLLEFERGGAISAGRLRAALDRVQRLVATESGEASEVLSDPDISLAFSTIEIDIRALEMTELRVMSSLQVGQNPGSVSSLLKLRWSEIHQSVTRLGLRLLGSDALIWESQRPMHLDLGGVVLDDVARPVVAGYLNARAYTIFGGTSEIQREIIARDVIG